MLRERVRKDLPGGFRGIVWVRWVSPCRSNTTALWRAGVRDDSVKTADRRSRHAGGMANHTRWQS